MLRLFIVLLIWVCHWDVRGGDVSDAEQLGQQTAMNEAAIFTSSTTTTPPPPNATSALGDLQHRELQGQGNIVELYAEAPATSTPITILYEPPCGFLSVSALGVSAMCKSPYNKPTCRIYYSFEKLNTVPAQPTQPTEASPYATINNPYIHMDSPFGTNRNRTVTLVAVDTATNYRSEPLILWYLIEAEARPGAYAFMVPGVETDGYFVKLALEMKAQARAQAAGGQEFADFNTNLGVGTYSGQIVPLHLPNLDPDLNGFEGGFSVNCSISPALFYKGNHYGNLPSDVPAAERTRHYGVIVPFHNGARFVGKVVRVDMWNMDNATACMLSVRREWVDSASGAIRSSGPSSSTACITILDLQSMNPNARGFRRGFTQLPYSYLSPSEFSVAVRLDVCNFGLSTTKMIDLAKVDSTFGGYAGGFADKEWSCFSPMKTFVGPFGGLRSSEPVDMGQMTAFFHGVMPCVHQSLWSANSSVLANALTKGKVYTVDFSQVSPELRGFSEAIRVGRFAYFSPLASAIHDYSSKVVKLYLGETNIGDHLASIRSTGGDIRDFVDTLDLSQYHPEMRGYSGIFNSGKYLFLVPYRNIFDPRIGQRGHGWATRVDMNKFSLDGIDFIAMEVQSRAQIPSTADEDLRGFSCGFASGKYSVFVPFFSGLFSGKVARIVGGTTPMGNLQELDMQLDRLNPNTFKAFRGGFVSLWKGTE